MTLELFRSGLLEGQAVVIAALASPAGDYYSGCVFAMGEAVPA